uniref:Uncharacterized protein n=1 Tax=Timema genevievae TaxID=629358 RepID=A0A7R9K9C8_TIMGE|nr:unnamed protein product [Timema genevievae]
MKMILMSACVVMLCSLCGGATVSSDPKQLTGGSGNRGPYDCPLCDSSVYSYCSNKLLHDACCCISPKEKSKKRIGWVRKEFEVWDCSEKIRGKTFYLPEQA